VIAEGVGTQVQLDFLADRGCDCFQGYWVSRPLPAEEFERFVRAGAAKAAPEELLASQGCEPA
jgi:EAL domain-containing protein (putative c-di-GMP-specific phosphodiesterase class I)